MLTKGGGRKPSDVFGSAVVDGIWPEDASISQIKQVGEKYREEAVLRLDRAGQLERSRSGIMESIQSVHADAMYERLAKITRDQNALADNAAEIFKGAEEMARECTDLQLSLVSVVEAHRPDWDVAIESSMQQNAAVVLATARAKATAAVADSAGWIAERGARISSRLTEVTPASWGPGADTPGTAEGGDGAAGDPTIKAVSNEPGRPGDDRSDQLDTPTDERSTTEEPGQRGDDRSDELDTPGEEEAGSDVQGKKGEGRPGGLDGTSGDSGSSGGGSGAGGSSSGGGASSLGGLPSGGGSGGSGGGSGGGLGSMGSGLGSPPSLSDSGLSQAGSPGAMSPGGLMGAGSSAGSGAGAGGSGSGSSSGSSSASGVRIPPPTFSSSAAPPAAAAAAQPAAGPVSASPAAAGGFGQAGTSAVSGGSPGGGGMPMGAPMAPAVPPPAHPGPAPTASPGLSQGSPAAPAGAAGAAAAGGAGAAGVAAASAAPYSAAVPKKIDPYGQQAVEAVKALAPATARLPGLVAAAAVVASRGGHPQLVMATNDGAGFLPEGFFMPAGMLHAFADLNSAEFDAKWFGWSDPSRVLLDYAVSRGQSSGAGMQVLGLACSAQVSGETKEIFPDAVPVVRPEADAAPVGEDGGRNAHRLKVLAPLLYTDLMSASEPVCEQAAVRATEAAMNLPSSAPLRAAGGPWHIMMSGRALDPAEWQALRGRYSELVGTYGAMRPGFMSGDLLGQFGTGYQSQFQLVRAIEVLLGWETAPDVSARDIIYAAHQAGADINRLLS